VPTVHIRALRRAAELCGERDLAIRLGVSDRELRLWTEGFAIPPERVFLEVVDLLGEHALREIQRR
jgi:DNA-binding transcriptional regulator YiaG